jgi:hypothetical protein
MVPVIELIEVDLTAECIPVNPEEARCARLVSAGPVQNPLNEFLFEFVHCFVELNASLHHLPNQRFQLIFHRRTLRTRMFAAGHSSPRDLFEFVAC